MGRLCGLGGGATTNDNVSVRVQGSKFEEVAMSNDGLVPVTEGGKVMTRWNVR